MSRKYLLVPGVRSNNIYVVDTASDPRAPKIHKVVDGSEIKKKTTLHYYLVLKKQSFLLEYLSF